MLLGSGKSARGLQRGVAAILFFSAGDLFNPRSRTRQIAPPAAVSRAIPVSFAGDMLATPLGPGKTDISDTIAN
jgi:hypothetical protein